MTEESTAIEQPAPSLDDQIREALAESQEAEKAKAEPKKAEKEPEEPAAKESAKPDPAEENKEAKAEKAEKSDDKAEKSEKESKSDKPEEKAEPDDESEKAESDDDKLEPPKHWSKADKQRFAAHPREAQEFLLERHKAMEADYTRKTQEVAEKRKSYENFDKILEPFKDEFAKRNITPTQYVNSLVEADKFIRSNPAGAIKAIMQQNQLTPEKLGFVQGEDQGQVDPQVQNLQAQLAKMQQYIVQQNQMTRQQQEQEQKAAVGQHEQKIQAFIDQADDDGNLAHPYADELIEDMVVLAQANRSAGRSTELKDLYEQALWSNPETRAKVQAMRDEQERIKRAKQDKERASRAKASSASVRSESGAAPSEVGSVEEILRQQMRA